MTNFKLIFAVLIGSLFLMASCSNMDELSYESNNVFSLICKKPENWISTRVATELNGSGTFVDSDCIEVFRENGESIILEYKEGKWTPELKGCTINSKLSALYPVLDSSSDKQRKVCINADQTTLENYIKSDILFATTTVKPGDPSTIIYFKHAMHRINIHLEGTIPDDLEIAVHSLLNGEISVMDGAVTVCDADYVWLKPYRIGTQDFSLLILPQDAQPFHVEEGLIRLTTKGKTISYKLDSSIKSFEAGKQTTINLTLKSDGTPVDEFCNKTWWVYGVKAPSFPGRDNIESYSVNVMDFPEGQWFRIAYEELGLPDEIEYLTWNKGCGWYDCNKRYDYVGDGNMCWAATASNLLHWWMNQNKKYIEAYDAEFGPEYPSKLSYARPSADFVPITQEKQDHSEIFNFFKNSFNNQASWASSGVNWFINGNTTNLITSNKKDFEGFFRKVFKPSDIVTTDTRNMSKEVFNSYMKDAFLHNRAIGFVVYDIVGVGTGMHAMTIWGAEFDSDGNVSYIYFCDNNYGEDEPNHASMKRFKVIYDKSSLPGITSLYTYICQPENKDGVIGRKFSLNALMLVDLRQDIWKKKYPNIE